MIRVVLIGSHARVGKDTLADFLMKRKNSQKKSFATKIKEIVGDLYKFSDEQLYGSLKDIVDNRYGHTPRFILQETGRFHRKHFPNVWAAYVFNSIPTFQVKDLTVLIPDFRFPNEHEEGIKWKNVDPQNREVITIRIDRPDRPVISGAEDISETALDTFENWDLKVLNNGTLEDLYNQFRFWV